ncbi:MAG: ethyl tert-butyl ether degradation protein EthD [Acidovorax sp. SCN 65-108]|nr:MAG: ethyl tert-butyl ether degradation protein EthD [Acidovorax sp. SCN 65-108]OJV64171.1 MAG: ethyl tert-butyl ether degradation protein EthD [Burkholderiales bacterium 64-34]
MIKVTAVYRWREGAHFNHDYYHSEHMRLARAALQPLGLVRLESDRVLYPGDPRPGQVVALTNAFFSDLQQAQAAAQQTAAVLMADVPNYTNIAPESYMAQWNEHSLAKAD